MLEGKRVAVVVPAFDEERLVGETLRGIPEFVDRVYVVDDASRDGTAAAVEAVGDPRVELLRHERNLGVGAAIATGYRRALEESVGRDVRDGGRQPDGPRPSSEPSSSRSPAASSSTRRRTVSSPARRGRSSRTAATSGTPCSRS